jgi:hypothetical protein
MALDIPVAGTPLDRGLLSGKRRAKRTRRTIHVDCYGPESIRAVGQTVDVSRGGMLLEMTDDEFRAPKDPSRLVRFASRLARTFPAGMEVTFGEGAVRGHAKIVRLVASLTGKTPILLGCRFEPPLGALDCMTLGLEEAGDEREDGATSESVTPAPVVPAASRDASSRVSNDPSKPTRSASSPAPAAKAALAKEEPVAVKDPLLELINDPRASWDGDVGERCVDPAVPSTPAPVAAPAGEGLDENDLRRVHQTQRQATRSS